jgi:hypothetical protein
VFFRALFALLIDTADLGPAVLSLVIGEYAGRPCQLEGARHEVLPMVRQIRLAVQVDHRLDRDRLAVGSAELMGLHRLTIPAVKHTDGGSEARYGRSRFVPSDRQQNFQHFSRVRGSKLCEPPAIFGCDLVARARWSTGIFALTAACHNLNLGDFLSTIKRETASHINYLVPSDVPPVTPDGELRVRGASIIVTPESRRLPKPSAHPGYGIEIGSPSRAAQTRRLRRDSRFELAQGMNAAEGARWTGDNSCWLFFVVR